MKSAATISMGWKGFAAHFKTAELGSSAAPPRKQRRGSRSVVRLPLLGCQLGEFPGNLARFIGSSSESIPPMTFLVLMIAPLRWGPIWSASQVVGQDARCTSTGRAPTTFSDWICPTGNGIQNRSTGGLELVCPSQRASCNMCVSASLSNSRTVAATGLSPTRISSKRQLNRRDHAALNRDFMV